MFQNNPYHVEYRQLTSVFTSWPGNKARTISTYLQYIHKKLEHLRGGLGRCTQL